MRLARFSSLALLAGIALGLDNGCGRASEQELLAGKSCSSGADCIRGYVCDSVASVCVRSGYVLTSDPDETHDIAEDPQGSAGAAGADSGSAGASSGPGGASGGEAGASSGGSSAGTSGAGGAEIAGAGGTDVGGAGGNDGEDPPDAGGSDAGVTYTPDAAAGPPSWVPISPPPAGFAARQKAAYAVAGDKVLIWGGVDGSGVELSTGAIYDATNDTWQLTSITGATPPARVLANAAWTGSTFLVWGGRTNSGSSEYHTGALYEPGTQTWTPTANQATARSGAITLPYTAQALVYAGWTRTGVALDKGARYAVAGDSWVVATNDVLGKREHFGWAGAGSRLYVAGGRSNTGVLLSTAGVYDIGTNSWSALPALPAVRFGLFGAHDGTQFWVWGGRDAQAAFGSGLLLGASQWSPTGAEGEPSARWAAQRQSGWTCRLNDGRLALSGGHDFADTPLRDGGVYSPSTDSWAPIPSAGEDHDWGVGVCVNGTLLLWGGTNGGTVTASGERWSP
jgi:hypothetical protein